MLTLDEYRMRDGLGLAELVRAREVTPAELLEVAIARTEQVNGALNCVVTGMYDEARRHLTTTATTDAPFSGVPFLLKDLTLHYKGARLTNGSRFFSGYVSDHDSELTARYKEAGATIFGKTASPEFGITASTDSAIFGSTRNPWNTDRSPGGSSGGAASAVASGIVPMAQAGDAGGSIRIPASCCGLFGLKPTRGRVPTGPDTGEGLGGVACAHVISRSVRDSAAMLDATSRPDPGAPYHAAPPAMPFLDSTQTAPRRLRIALQRRAYNGVMPAADCIAAIEDAARLCEALGHVVEDVDLPVDTQIMDAVYSVLFPTQVLLTLEKRERDLGRPLAPGDLEEANAAYLDAARELSARDYAEAIHRMHRFGRSFAAHFDRYDMILSPTIGVVPPAVRNVAHEAAEESDYRFLYIMMTIFNEPANLSGCPSMSVPLWWNADGLPIGSLFTARYGTEGDLFALAAQLEQARPWFDRVPDSL